MTQDIISSISCLCELHTISIFNFLIFYSDVDKALLTIGAPFEGIYQWLLKTTILVEKYLTQVVFLRAY